MKKCKGCQKEIDGKAIKCPYCQTDQRGFVKRHPIITGIGVFFLIIIVLGVIGSGSSSKNTGNSVPAAPDNTNSNQNKTSVPVQTPQQMQTLLNISGSGTKTTQKFTAASDWDLNWSYDCSNFDNQGNFQVYVYNGDGSMSIDNSGVNELGSSGNDVEHYHSAGTFYLEVNSECAWKINVKG